MDARTKVLAVKDISWCNKELSIIRLLYPLEIRLDYYQTKYQYNWMCGIHYKRSVCLSYYPRPSVCPVICPCIEFIFTLTLGSGNVKVYFIIVQPSLVHNLFLPVILGFNISLLCGFIKP